VRSSCPSTTASGNSDDINITQSETSRTCQTLYHHHRVTASRHMDVCMMLLYRRPCTSHRSSHPHQSPSTLTDIRAFTVAATAVGRGVSTGCVKIKRKLPNTKTAISKKCVNIFAPDFARLFNTTVQESDVSCCIYSTYAEMTETST